MTVSQDRQYLSNARTVLRGRAGRPTAANAVYKTYEIFLLALIVIFPLARAIVVGLAVPEVAVVVAGSLTLKSMTPTLLVLTIAVVVLGRIRGPVVLSAAYLDLVVASPLSRSVTLRQGFGRGRLGFVLLALFGASLLIGGAFFAGPIDVLGAGLFLVATVVSAWQISLLWLVGQLTLPVRRATILVLLVLLGVILLIAAIPTVSGIVAWLGPWGWVSQVWQAVHGGINFSTWIAFTALVLGIGAIRWTRRLLTSLSYDDLKSQTQRWGTIVMLTSSGDVRSAMNKLKAFPRNGRRWRFSFSRSPLLAIVLRDLIGLARFPVRVVFWSMMSVASGALLAYTFLPTSAGLLLAVIAPVVMYFAIGSWAEGLRFHASTIGTSSSSGISPGRQSLMHLIVPTVTAGLLIVSGALLISSTIPMLDVGVIVLWTVVMVAFLVAMQSFSAFKGMLPIELFTPIPTPFGDLSLLNVTFWLADAVMVVLVVAGGLTSLVVVTTSPVLAFVLLGCAGGLMGLWSWVRFRRLVRPW